METTFPSFFQDGDAEDPSYTNLRVFPDSISYKIQIEEDWQLICQLGLADPGFKQLNQAKTNFQGVFWELRLASILYKQGHQFYPRKEKGPDFTLKHSNNPIHIECVAPTPGDENKVDSVPKPIEESHGLCSTLRPTESGFAPENEILLRLTSSLDAKCSIFKSYIETKVIEPTAPCVIAINGNNISLFNSPIEGIPQICRVLFGMGQLYKTPTGSMVFQHREKLHKTNGESVPSIFFDAKGFEIISGVLYSDIDISNPKELFFIPNPNAINPVPPGIFDFCTQYFPESIEDGLITLKIIAPTQP